MDDLRSEIRETLTTDEAVAWLRSVDGELYRTPPGRHAARAWVAVVRTPASSAERGQLIVALGDTALEAATAAASHWRAAWSRVPHAV